MVNGNMKVGELKKILENVNDNEEVVIEVERPGAVGPVPHVHVDHVYSGFDWESGLFLISTVKKLKECEPKEKD